MHNPRPRPGRAVRLAVACVSLALGAWLVSAQALANADPDHGPTSAAPASATAQLPCLQAVPGVSWERWESGGGVLDSWCASVGPPVVRSSPREPAELTHLLILSWNIHVGGGRVEDLLARVFEDMPDPRRTGVVLLLQEAYRSGRDVPASYPSDVRVPSAIRPRRPGTDVVGLGERLGMSVAYVPSMRNGPATSLSEREDRGNAVLSSETLSDVRAIELPFGKQRRVAVAATVTPRGGVAPFRVVAAHFDTNGDRVEQAEALGERIAALDDLPVVVGGDLNARSGFRDGAVQAVGQRIPIEACGTGRTHRWPLRLDTLAFFVGRLDFVFSQLSSQDVPRTCETLPDAFGSDHLPVLLTVRYQDAE